jgi:hypothetical protein
MTEQICQPYSPAALYTQEDFWYKLSPRAIVLLEGLGKLKKKILPYRESNPQPFLL